MMKPQRGFLHRGSNTGPAGAAGKPNLSPTQASLARPASALHHGSPRAVAWRVGGELPPAVVKGHAAVPAMASSSRSCRRAGWGRVQGQGSQSGDGLQQLRPA